MQLNRYPTMISREIVAPIEHIRRYALSALIDDLDSCENSGFEESTCDRVRLALGRLATLASEIPDGSRFQRTILDEVDVFQQTYARWNGIEGDTKSHQRKRRSMISKLRKYRQRMEKRIHLNQHILTNQLDTNAVTATYQGFEALVTAAPEVFRGVADALTAMASSSQSAAPPQ